ncbi:response regulator transcription factor [uncultured Draconibacterium sp.]|uniref:response regulator n=1 Tax=uncultured Draconibacterium sp. TaxID=1573823 RepID=UPI0029BFB073|nr:response regulator transcription factor [uncultured Draconibacterium sp.]
MKIKLIIADDHRIFSEGLITVLNTDESIEIAGVAKDGKEAIDKAFELDVDILIMDISMPKMDGIEATRYLKTKLPSLKIIALSMHAEKQYVIKMLKAGIDGYVLKNNSSQELLHAIHSVYNNKKYLSADVTPLIISDYIDKKIKAVSR